MPWGDIFWRLERRTNGKLRMALGAPDQVKQTSSHSPAATQVDPIRYQRDRSWAPRVADRRIVVSIRRLIVKPEPKRCFRNPESVDGRP
jgi:hypothetical protein